MRIYFGENVFYNRTKNSIVIEGNRTGFLSLSNAILYWMNDLRDFFTLTTLPYVESDLTFSIQIDDKLDGISCGMVSSSGNNNFVWKMSEAELCEIVSVIHSLGYINSELHFDEDKSKDEVTVYCVLQ